MWTYLATLWLVSGIWALYKDAPSYSRAAKDLEEEGLFDPEDSRDAFVLYFSMGVAGLGLISCGPIAAYWVIKEGEVDE